MTPDMTPPYDDAHAECNLEIHLLKEENERLAEEVRGLREVIGKHFKECQDPAAGFREPKP